MQQTFHIRIKKDFAVAVIEDLQKMKAVEVVKEETPEIPEWQKKAVRKRIKEAKKNPFMLLDEDVVFKLLKNG